MYLMKRTSRCLSLPAIALLALSPAFGADMVGAPAPKFEVSETVNEAPALNSEEMKGEVILIKYWGTQ